MDAPDYLVCLECETPCYTFEWEGERLVEVLCQACGNENPEMFIRPEELEELT
jgi:translation initiation factor 2 beta subunit (eIF-2beta)/eIF-5